MARPGIMIAVGVKPKRPGGESSAPTGFPRRLGSLPGAAPTAPKPSPMESPMDEPTAEGDESREVGHIDPVSVHLHGPDETCGGCEYFSPPTSCHEVRGSIDETMWCCLYSPKGGGEGELAEPMSAETSEPSGAEEGEY